MSISKIAKIYIDDCLSEKGSHASLSALCKDIIKKELVFDDEEMLWFHCNLNNVWNKRKSNVVIMAFLKKYSSVFS